MFARKHVSLLPLAALLMAILAGNAVAAPPSPPWKAQNIGKPIAPGSVDVDVLGRWLVRASNGDIGTIPKKLDDFFFIHQPLSGDGSIIALLLGQEGGNQKWAKAGLMIRENEGAGARNLLLAMTTGHGLLITDRPVARKTTVNEGADSRYGPRRFPTWLRLQREGDQFTPFASTDGFGWTQLHSPITLRGFPKDALAGIATSAYQEGLTIALFGDPIVAPGVVSPIVQVYSGHAAVLLAWPPVSNAIGYTVRRSAPNSPGFVADLLTPQPIKETSFMDAGLVDGQPLRYLVSAVFDQGGQPVEAWPTAVTAAPLALPGGLFGCDLNLEVTQSHGGVVFNPLAGSYTIAGAGGAWGTEDHGFCASRLVTGDFQITARILDRPSGTAKASRAGVIVRETLDGPSRMAFLAGTAASGVTFEYRKKAGAAAAGQGKPVIADKAFRPPLFLRLVRRGATVTPFVSVDGTTFKPAGKPQRFDPPLADSLFVGYAITSQNAGLLARSSFSDLAISPPSAP